MASIENVQLQIVEVNGSAVALVNYRLRGSAHDAQHLQAYREVVELIGVDQGLGEDGVNEPIPNGMVFSGAVAFTNTAPFNRPQRVLPLPSSALDEDPNTNPIGLFPIEDEIQARVTLTQIHPAVTGNSNVVRRGGPVIANRVPTPA